ncbi:GNAT family N-acetyltransferase [Pseudoflavitalea sp. G-6-1-2]|uniref:GNAT family N-acetyltransferase n=1 Tax=Pseudoflavitalea sp. G-6-1-2 TaxID=2728841 RepID=UPI00146AEA7F|nr:GNAT family N-acetyltransferase [Pseudoflavitalea sp. G-6-1-2]NML20718.1 GNAT family N-acetyltransferase [Pseudoflavitalea sp. G-6-1-2]
MNNILYRSLRYEDLSLIRDIDRSEEIFSMYKLKEGRLIAEPHRESVTDWDEVELEQLILNQQVILQNKGVVIGAFDHQKLIGAASVENLRRGNSAAYFKLDILYVSKRYRGHRIGKHLMNFCKTIGRNFGGDKLYISATPTKHTVDFYMRHGAVLAEETDTALLEKEPDDIHLELFVG